MTRAAVEQVIGKLLLDAEFRGAVRANAPEALAGFDLTTEEREALAQLDSTDIEAVANELDPRISKATRLLPIIRRLGID